MRSRFFLISMVLTLTYRFSSASELLYSAGINIGASRRMIGGVPVSITEYPFMVQVVTYFDMKKLGFCSGIIISKQNVLSAAHCVSTRKTTSLPIIFSGSQLSQQGRKHIVERINIHDDFQGVNLRNDIAMINMKDMFIFDPVTRPAKLPLKGFQLDEHSSLRAIGWGAVNLKHSLQPHTANVLLSVSLISMNRIDCLRILAKYHVNSSVSLEEALSSLYTIVSTSTHCGLAEENTCVCDPGGTIVSNDHVVGLISAPFFEYDTYVQPTVFTKITPYLDWIYSKTDMKSSGNYDNLPSNNYFENRKFTKSSSIKCLHFSFVVNSCLVFYFIFI